MRNSVVGVILDPREAVEVGRRQRGGERRSEPLAIRGEDRQLAREGAGGGLAEVVFEGERDAHFGLGGQEVGGEGLFPGVDRREMRQRLAPRPGDQNAAAADQRVGAAQRGDIQAGQPLGGVRRVGESRYARERGVRTLPNTRGDAAAVRVASLVGVAHDRVWTPGDADPQRTEIAHAAVRVHPARGARRIGAVVGRRRGRELGARRGLGGRRCSILGHVPG
jgi:hypothetical protein